jgi:hypothetical protein
MEATLAYAHAVWLFYVCSFGNVKPVDSAHFMGGIIRWRPVNPAAFDGTVSCFNNNILQLSQTNDATYSACML